MGERVSEGWVETGGGGSEGRVETHTGDIGEVTGLGSGTGRSFAMSPMRQGTGLLAEGKRQALMGKGLCGATRKA